MNGASLCWGDARCAPPQSLGPLHPYVVRTAVWASLYLLPSREHFISQVCVRITAVETRGG